ncbi:MAG: hypothetical protein ACK5MA_02920 [Parachlamydiaceae bacterium]
MDRSPSKPLTAEQLEKFRSYLEQQEAKLADSLLLSTVPPSSSLGVVHLHGSGHFQLTQALQFISHRIKDLKESDTIPGEWKIAVTSANSALWKFLEVLEEAVNELVEHLKAAKMGEWNEEFYSISLKFKELISHRIEDAIWLYRRLEELYLTYRATCQKQRNLWAIFGKLWSPFTTILDKQVLNRLFKAEENLSAQFKLFAVGYETFNTFKKECGDAEKKWGHMSCFQELSEGEQSLFLKLFRFLTIWEGNNKKKFLEPESLISAIKSLAKSGTVTLLYREYYKSIKIALFDLSVAFQASLDTSCVPKVKQLKKELLALGGQVSAYREILLRGDPNPYVRSRWSVSEWTLGPEPRKTKDLLQLIYDIEMMDRWFDQLVHSIEKEPISQRSLKKAYLQRQIGEVFHEMGQPLASRNMMQAKCDRLIELLEGMDELSGSMGISHEEFADYLLKALSLDTRHLVLFDNPKFEELFLIHEGFISHITDLSHEKRSKLFKQSIQHISYWLKEHEVMRHEKEIDIDEGAIQEEFQKLFAAVQRGDLPQSGAKESYFEMLLEYRFQFSKFFYNIKKYEEEGRLIRKHFQFVDQYLESIEKTLRQEPTLSSFFR